MLSRYIYPLWAVLLMWGVMMVEVATGTDFGQYLGIVPHDLNHLIGVATVIFVHGSFEHLLNNTVPFVILSSIIIGLYPTKVATRALVFIWLATGMAVWLFGRPSNHIGASGLVYGMVTLVFWAGIFRHSRRAIVVSLVVMFLYSGMFLGILPIEEGISWESHLFGAVFGIVAAYIFRKELALPDQEIISSPDMPQQYWLARDTFEKTKRQRYLEQQSSMDHT